MGIEYMRNANGFLHCNKVRLIFRSGLGTISRIELPSTVVYVSEFLLDSRNLQAAEWLVYLTSYKNWTFRHEDLEITF